MGDVALVLDLGKAFERVSLLVVWAWATHPSFPRKILRVLCGYSEHQWRVQFEGCVAEPLQTITAIMPGSKWSSMLLRIVLQDALSEVTEVYPPLKLRVFVDDIAASGNGRNKVQIKLKRRSAEKGLEIVDHGKGEGGGANHLMTRCPRVLLHSKVWRSAPSCTRLCHCRQSRPSCHYQTRISGRHCTWSTERKNRRHWRRRPENMTFAHLELERMCARRKSAVPPMSVDTLFMGSKRIDQSMNQPSRWDTEVTIGWQRERQESVALHTLSQEDVVGHVAPTRQSLPRAAQQLTTCQLLSVDTFFSEAKSTGISQSVGRGKTL